MQNTEQALQIQALEHLIEAEFEPEKSCQSVCLLAAQLFKNSEDKLIQKLADVAHKAYLASAETLPMK